MSKIGIIIQREFNQRVKKKSFIITTLLMPLLMVGLMVAPVIIAMTSKTSQKNITVVDSSRLIGSKLKSNSEINFIPTDKTAEELRNTTKSEEDKEFGYLVIGSDIMSNPSNIQLYSYEPSTMDVEKAIRNQIEDIIEGSKLEAYNIDNISQILNDVKTNVTISTFRIDEDGKDTESSSAMSFAIAYIFGFMIYMFVFIYGGMVMQGVVEEKSSKVLEIMVSSVKPFELMLGKILGIAAVAITQVLIWVVLIFAIGTVATSMITPDAETISQMTQGATMGVDINQAASGIDAKTFSMIKTATDIGYLAKLFGGFVIFFIGGYLLYAAMFAAIGSAVDNVADTQQLQLPVSIPLILAIVVLMNAMQDPNGSLAFWFSIIPFTSPIIMMARIPYGVPAWELALSIVVLYASFTFMVWLAGKIYRVGIFMYGKKPSLKELIKWSRYKY